jgi:alpha-tubulin suppressor-like RCC1 family protein
MSRIQATTNFIDRDGGDLGTNLVTKDYLISVYPKISQQIGIPPELWGWGRGGALGNGDSPNVVTPVTTSAGGTNWKQVSCGNEHTAAIKTDGTLWTWGSAQDGALGNNRTTDSVSTPITTFAGGTNWRQVSCGFRRTSAIKTDGTLWTWGYNFAGALGNNLTIDRFTPVTTFAGGTNWKQVSSGRFHTSSIKTDGTLWTWGDNSIGQLGVNVTTNRSTPVTTFAGGTNWKQVDCGRLHTAAIKTDGTLWTWGDGTDGELGNFATTNRSTPVTTFAGGTNWKQVSGGDGFTAAIKTDGTLWTWGSGGFGQLGINATGIRSTPVTTFTGGTNWKQVDTGLWHMAAIKTDGTLWTSGDTTGNQAGGVDTLTPTTTFAGGTNWKQVSVGDDSSVPHTMAIRSVDF